MINIYLMGEMAFIDLGDGYMLCIGSKTEVDEASPTRLWEMVNEAVVHSRYRSISSSKGMVLQ